jgi:hypothetical protein
MDKIRFIVEGSLAIEYLPNRRNRFFAIGQKFVEDYASMIQLSSRWDATACPQEIV